MPPSPTIASSSLRIGMEVHVELATRSKMFTRTANIAHPDHYDAAPNTLVDPVVAALPGTLPVMNRAAVEMSMMVGLALNCRIAEFSKWDRKNYFYPDLPKGYQISQYDLPLCSEGWLEIETTSGTRRIGITRAHLEEDTGKLGHELPGGGAYAGSLVDLNRAGTPLLEIVSEPDMTSADEAVVYAEELRNLCVFLGVTEGVMQRGHVRFEPNVNVVIRTADGREHATPIVEVKNLNSFRALRAAIEHEHGRQVQQWLEDRRVQGPGAKSTRGWDDQRLVTVLQREKEDAQDYRYFPDPDLVPVKIDQRWRDAIAARLPELPMQRRQRYRKEYDLTQPEAFALTADRGVCAFYEACVDAVHERRGSQVPAMHTGRGVAKLLLNAGARFANERETTIDRLGITPHQVADLLALRDDDRIGSSAADALFAILCDSDARAETAAQEHGLLQVRDEGQLEQWIDAALAAQPQAAADFAAGKDAALGRLVGETMKRSGGQADATLVRARLGERLRG